MSIKLVNPQPMSGLFETKLPIYGGDDKTKVLTRIMKTDRSKMKGTTLSLSPTLSLSLVEEHIFFKCIYLSNMCMIFADISQIKLVMYEDPIKGPRAIPDMNNIEKGKVVVPDNATFQVNVADGKVTIQSNGKKVDFGQTLVYIVNS